MRINHRLLAFEYLYFEVRLHTASQSFYRLLSMTEFPSLDCLKPTDIESLTFEGNIYVCFILTFYSVVWIVKSDFDFHFRFFICSFHRNNRRITDMETVPCTLFIPFTLWPISPRLILTASYWLTGTVTLYSERYMILLFSTRDIGSACVKLYYGAVGL